VDCVYDCGVECHDVVVDECEDGVEVHRGV